MTDQYIVKTKNIIEKYGREFKHGDYVDIMSYIDEIEKKLKTKAEARVIDGDIYIIKYNMKKYHEKTGYSVFEEVLRHIVTIKDDNEIPYENFFREENKEMSRKNFNFWSNLSPYINERAPICDDDFVFNNNEYTHISCEFMEAHLYK